MGCYLVALLLIGRRWDSLGPKRMAIIACAVITASNILTALAGSVWMVLALVGVNGTVTVLLWPPMMSWASSGLSGKKLNWQMAVYNFSWSSGMILGSWIGGVLWEKLATGVFYVAAAATLISLGITSLSRRKYQPGADVPPLEVADPSLPMMDLFRRMAQIALLVSWFAMGAIRFPVANLIKSMSLGSDVHGAANACINLTLMSAMLLLGRTSRWHCRLGPFIGLQLLLAVMLTSIGFSMGAVSLCAFCGIAALGVAIGYTSHMFYSLSSGRNRMASMRTHEVILSLGFVVGSLGGGQLVHYLGPRNFYPVAGAVVALAVGLEIAIYMLGSRTASAARNVKP
jgi:DHA1 family multidrug resistance protein-like MFS transporter/DHA1 family quinolone resistance protein-like MFS transporter